VRLLVWTSVCLLLSSSSTWAAQDPRAAFAVELNTAHRLPVFQPKSKRERAGVWAAKSALSVLSEGQVVGLILDAAPELMNAGGKEGATVRSQLKKRYAELADDPLWADVESPLHQAFEQTTPTMLVAPPRNKTADAKTAPVVVFLHGYGGNGRLFTWLLSRALPDCWVVSPSHGVSWRAPVDGYLDDALQTFASRTGRSTQDAVLVGLSDGGVGAFEVLRRHPKTFAGVVNIAALPTTSAAPKLPRRVPQLWLNGRRDRFVSAQRVRQRRRLVEQRGIHVDQRWFNSGHYFLLDDDGKALEAIRGFVRAVHRSRGQSTSAHSASQKRSLTTTWRRR